MFFWKKKEKELETRNYTGLAVGNIENSVSTSGSISLATTAIREVAAGFWGRAFCSAEVESPVNIITPSHLFYIGRQLIVQGQALLEINVNGEGMISLRPISTFDITGGPDPESWEYKIEVPGPSLTVDKQVGWDSIIHIIYGASSQTPWQGCSPIDAPSTTSQLAAVLEDRLNQEAGTVTGFVLPLPAAANTPQLRSDLGTLEGSLAPVESVSTNYDTGGRAPMSDWKSCRLGAMIPDSSINLRKEVNAVLLAACGIQPTLIDARSESNALREAYRIFLHATISPVAKLIEEELSRKLENEIMLDFSSMFAADIQGRSRGFNSLTSGGMSPENAARICGFPE